MLRLQRRDSAVRRGVGALAGAEARLLLRQLRGRLRLRRGRGAAGAGLPSGFRHQMGRSTRHRRQHRRRRPRVQRYRAAGTAWDAPRVRYQGVPGLVLVLLLLRVLVLLGADDGPGRPDAREPRETRGRARGAAYVAAAATRRHAARRSGCEASSRRVRVQEVPPLLHALGVLGHAPGKRLREYVHLLLERYEFLLDAHQTLLQRVLPSAHVRHYLVHRVLCLWTKS